MCAIGARARPRMNTVEILDLLKNQLIFMVCGYFYSFPDKTKFKVPVVQIVKTFFSSLQ